MAKSSKKSTASSPKPLKKSPANRPAKGRPSPTKDALAKIRENQEAVKEIQSAQSKIPHTIITARAGTGKTTTLVCGLQVLRGEEPHVLVPIDVFDPSKGTTRKRITPSPQQSLVWDTMQHSSNARSICFVAFNKAIAEELKRRVPAGVAAMTLHALGNQIVNNTYGRLRSPNGYRVTNIIEELLGVDIKELWKNKPDLVKGTGDLVSLVKQTLADRTDDGWLGEHDEAWEEILDGLASYYELELNGSREEVYKLVPRVIQRCLDVPQDRYIDFDDMIWLPVRQGLARPTYDLLLVDEAQDLNRMQQAMVQILGRRLILCGDPKQAIYGFAGADAESMPRMFETLQATDQGCENLYLTVTRRCGKRIVEEAQKYVPDFEAHESNPEGQILQARYEEVAGPCQDCRNSMFDSPGVELSRVEACMTCGGTGVVYESYTSQVQDGDMILCRVNAPLVSQCFKFLKMGRKANIRGRDVGQGLIKTIKKLKVDNIVDLISGLAEWFHNETKKETAKKNPSDQKLIALQDRYDCLQTFCEDAKTVEEVIQRIEDVFSDKDSPGILLSSVHKAKGLEAERVFILQPQGATMPHPMAKSAWQKDQEYNLLYVATTRAIQTLVYVS